MKISVLVPALVGLAALSAPVGLQAQILVNGGFDAVDGLSSWTSFGNLGVLDQVASQAAYGFLPINGTQLVFFNGGNTTPNGILSQSFATTVGASYEVNYTVGRGDLGPGFVALQATAADAGNNVLASQTVIPELSGWHPPAAFTFTATTPSTTLIFSDLSQATTGVDVTLDAVTVDLVVVPEPAEYAAAAGLALVGFGMWRRMRR